MIIASASADDRIRLIAIEMKGAFGNEGALPLYPSIWKPGNQEEDGGLAMALKISWLPGFQIRSPGSCKAAVIAALRSQLSLARYVLRYFIPVRTFRKTSFQHVVQRLDQVGNRFFGFIAHVGETEGLAFYFAV